ncbi:baculoviral IAP repeat-containing protein 7-B-like [Macrosteles quadrilineatus]|uniref:baculoviral IAP repeat-containing protein 7-B-like n=1 Tax=Macrosteles quadrilineatus TaxID=74068 RepID=UPI0023E1C18C|nr:baculoviral IAP repeat-containing protein 7-B-like [Macrosteles quadrilineatus]
MSGRGRKHSFKERDDDWTCDNCHNVNFSWRVQCNRCTQLKNENSSGGLGVGTAVLAGAGVALVGFLGQKLWNSFQSSSTLPAKQSSDPSPTSSYWVPPTPKQSQPQPTSTVDMKTEKKIDIPLEFACVICKENQRRICLLPCKHVCLCNECAKRVKEICPMCMQKFDKQENVFL